MPTFNKLVPTCLLWCVGMLVLSGCSGSQSTADPDQSQSIIVLGRVIMQDSTTVQNARVRTVPITWNVTTDEMGRFRIDRRLQADEEYVVIVRHPDPEYDGIEGRVSGLIVKEGEVFNMGDIIIGKSGFIGTIGVGEFAESQTRIGIVWTGN